MRGPLVPVVAVALLLVAACGGDGGSLPPAADPTTPPTVSPSTEPIAPATTSEPTTVTTDETSATEMAVLRPDGLGPVDFDTPAEQAIAELTELLGAPDRVEPIEPGGECVEGASWLDCIGERVVERGQLAVWDSYGLEVAMVDTARYDWSREPTRLQFGDWHATFAPGTARLVTTEGLSAGMTVGELRAAVPWVEFDYSEGVLGGFYASFGVRDGYWGGLDWDPDTADIEWNDVAAMQAALNSQGAELEVDGMWGPASQAAWLGFLSDHGLDSPALAAEWPLWLTPEIGRTLGLPPDDVIIASLQPVPATEATVSMLWLPILRADGLAGYEFGEPADELVDQLTILLGTPTDDTSYTPDESGPFDYLPQGFHAAYELRILTWNDPDFQVILSDVPYRGDHYDSPTPWTLTLGTWMTTSPRFRLDSGLGVGSTVAELAAQHPDVAFGTYSVCEDPYDPASFAWPWLHGTLDWDWVSDLQRALNARGTKLAVDGEYGPRTAAAVEQLQQDRSLDNANGWVGPETLAALDVEAPQAARIARLLGGSRGTC